MQGLYLGHSGGEIQLGDIQNVTIVRIPGSKINDIIVTDSLPGKSPDPVIINVQNTSHDYFVKHLCMLAAFNNVNFGDEEGSHIASGLISSSYDIYDSMGNPVWLPQSAGLPLVLYSSSYADFAGNELPYGNGTLQGIFTVYNTKFELLLRDTNDFVNFVDTGQTMIYHNNFETNPADWTIYTTSGNKPWTWLSSFECMAANGFAGNAPADTWLISPGLDLTNVSTPVLTFMTWTNYADIGLPEPLDVQLSTDYTGGDPANATWSPVSCVLAAQFSKIWTSSGDIDLSAYHQKVYIGFRYRSSGNGNNTCAAWEVDTFKLKGKKN
jgi:hypothetical protein